MENVMTNGFTELSENEMFGVDGGKLDLNGWECVGLTVAIVGCAWAAPIGLGVAITAGAGAGLATGGAIGLTSAGLIGKITDWY